MNDDRNNRLQLVGALAAMMAMPGPGIRQATPVPQSAPLLNEEQQAAFDQERILRAASKRSRRKAKRAKHHAAPVRPRPPEEER